MAKLKFLFLGPDNDLYAVGQDGAFWKDNESKFTGDHWTDFAVKIGTAGWDSFKLLFFGPNGDLYAVGEDDKFLKGSPPN